MVAQENNSARVVLARTHDFAKPVDLFGPKRTSRSSEIFQKRPTDRIIGRVQSYDAPMFVFQAKEAGLLAAWLPLRYQTKCRRVRVQQGHQRTARLFLKEAHGVFGSRQFPACVAQWPWLAPLAFCCAFSNGSACLCQDERHRPAAFHKSSRVNVLVNPCWCK